MFRHAELLLALAFVIKTVEWVGIQNVSFAGDLRDGNTDGTLSTRIRSLTPVSNFLLLLFTMLLI